MAETPVYGSSRLVGFYHAWQFRQDVHAFMCEFFRRNTPEPPWERVRRLAAEMQADRPVIVEKNHV